MHRERLLGEESCNKVNKKAKENQLHKVGKLFGNVINPQLSKDLPVCVYTSSFVKEP